MYTNNAFRIFGNVTVEQACRYAEQKHGLAKRRDGLVIDHIRDVVHNLQDLGIRDTPSICAAWLHDTIEDTDVEYNDICKKFGNVIADMVSSLSKDTRLPYDEQSSEYIRRLYLASPGAKAVKLADIMTNLDSIQPSKAYKSKHRKATKLRAYAMAICDGINPDLPGLPAAQKRLDSLLRIYNLEPVKLGP